MDWKVANEQQDEALWRVFLMFVAMAVLVIRTGLVSRGVLVALPSESAHQVAAPEVPDQSCSTSPTDIRQATLVLLCLAEAAGRLVILKERAVWELMDQPLPWCRQERPCEAADLCGLPAQRIDTS